MIIVWSDGAPVDRTFFSLVARDQYLVDSKLCDLVIFVFMANLHGKFIADSLFGQCRARARREQHHVSGRPA